jgi:hypothetical protein
LPRCSAARELGATAEPDGSEAESRHPHGRLAAMDRPRRLAGDRLTCDLSDSAMRVKLGIAVAGTALALLGFVLAGSVTPGASAHRSDAATTIATTTVPEESTSTATTATESSTTITTSTTTSTTTPVPELILPDGTLTPGVLNPKVRQSTIKKTICKRGWTEMVRPPVGYTNALKLRQMVMYGETGLPSDYEEDHFIPLELGGAPRSPKNLWPEPHSQSRVSDPLETKLKRQVCKRMLSLKAARAAIRAFKNTQG